MKELRSNFFQGPVVANNIDLTCLTIVDADAFGPDGWYCYGTVSMDVSLVKRSDPSLLDVRWQQLHAQSYRGSLTGSETGIKMSWCRIHALHGMYPNGNFFARTVSSGK
ncbi:hypothetical protein OH492_10190 [Vibrio chagasii]|nr:hypothetical protein [Vibrio chagasii]